MRRAIALAIIWLIATISVPYSHIFSLSVNGFSQQLNGVAWAGTDIYYKCWDSEASYKDHPLQYDDCLTKGNYCIKSTGYENDKCAEWYMCINGPSGDNQKSTIYCSRRTCGGETRNPVSSAYGAYVSRSDFVSEPECKEALSDFIESIDTTQWLVTPATKGASSYTIEEVSANECTQKCNGRNIGTNIVAYGGGCAETPPSTAGGTVAYTRIDVKCPRTPDGKAQRCYCVGINPQGTLAAVNTLTQSRTYSVGTSSLPGTGRLVDDPEEIKNPKRFAANDVDCSLPTKVSINATISAAAVPVGAPVTVSGEVAKFSDACSGVSYECRKQYQKGCRVEQGFFRTCVVYNSCNIGDKVIAQQGASCSWNWFQIIGLVLLAVSIFGALKPVSEAAKGASKAGQQAAASTSVLTKLEAVFGKNIGQVAIQLMQRSQQVYVPDGCNSICGHRTGTTALTATPLCDGYAIEQKEGHYRCRLTSCGGFENKEVTIEVRDASNNIVRSDTTTTDATGFYSFSFLAPSPAGSYSIVVSTEDPKVTADIVNVTSTR